MLKQIAVKLNKLFTYVLVVALVSPLSVFAIKDITSANATIIRVEPSQTLSEILWVWVKASPFRLYGKGGMIDRVRELNPSSVKNGGNLIFPKGKLIIPDELKPYMGSDMPALAGDQSGASAEIATGVASTPVNADDGTSTVSDLGRAAAVSMPTNSATAANAMVCNVEPAQSFSSHWGLGTAFKYVREDYQQVSNSATATLLSNFSPVFEVFANQDWGLRMHTGVGLEYAAVTWLAPETRSVSPSSSGFTSIAAHGSYDVNETMSLGAEVGERLLGTVSAPSTNALSYSQFFVPTYGLLARWAPIHRKSRTAYVEAHAGLSGTSKSSDDDISAGTYWGAETGFNQAVSKWTLGLKLFTNSESLSTNVVGIHRLDAGAGVSMSYELEESKP